MILRQSIILVMDTNVLADIVEYTRASRVDDALTQWFQSILDGMEEVPKERLVTFVVSTSILDDYKTGLFRRGCKQAARTVKTILSTKSTSNIHMSPRDQRIDLSFIRVPVDTADASVSDKYDRRFLGALQNAKNARRWEDRAIIFASCDALSRGQMRDSFTHDHARIRFPTSFDELNDSIAC